MLAGLDIDFEVDTENYFEETYSPDIPHESIPEILSEGKSHGFHRELADDEILITSDTLVLCGDRVMGKPHSREEAYDMLRFLSGREHKVITAVTIRDRQTTSTSSDTAIVNCEFSTVNLKRRAVFRSSFYVFLMNFSLHLGQLMLILPLPLGTRTCWRQRGQVKYR